MRAIWFVLLLLLPWSARAADPCEPCALPNGVYHAVAPAGWDGVTPLRLLLFLHGWRNTGTQMMQDPNITGAAGKYGFLLVAPDGEDRGGGTSWGHVGAPSRGRDDIAFLRAVVADAERRWRIDRRTVVAAGFSIGGSMVWDLACYAAPDFTAFLPFSGGFWEPMPEACASGPVVLRHTHGTHDSMVPMSGRAIMNGRFRQADIMQGMARWRAEDRCKAEPDSVAVDGALTCSSWTSCGAGTVQLCLHDGDHVMSGPMLEAGLQWVVGVRESQ